MAVRVHNIFSVVGHRLRFMCVYLDTVALALLPLMRRRLSEAVLTDTFQYTLCRFKRILRIALSLIKECSYKPLTELLLNFLCIWLKLSTRNSL